MSNHINKISKLLTDANVSNVRFENEDEKFGALTMLGYLQNRIYPILSDMREKK